MSHEIHIFQWDGSHQDTIPQNKRAGETRPILKLHLNGTNIGNKLGSAVRRYHLALFNSREFELDGNMFGNTQRHRAGIDERVHIKRLESWLARIRQLDRRVDKSHSWRLYAKIRTAASPVLLFSSFISQNAFGR